MDVAPSFPTRASCVLTASVAGLPLVVSLHRMFEIEDTQCMCACGCTCVCERKRETEGGRQAGRERRERERGEGGGRDRKGECGYNSVNIGKFLKTAVTYSDSNSAVRKCSPSYANLSRYGKGY